MFTSLPSPIIEDAPIIDCDPLDDMCLLSSGSIATASPKGITIRNPFSLEIISSLPMENIRKQQIIEVKKNKLLVFSQGQIDKPDTKEETSRLFISLLDISNEKSPFALFKRSEKYNYKNEGLQLFLISDAIVWTKRAGFEIRDNKKFNIAFTKVWGNIKKIEPISSTQFLSLEISDIIRWTKLKYNNYKCEPIINTDNISSIIPISYITHMAVFPNKFIYAGDEKIISHEPNKHPVLIASNNTYRNITYFQKISDNHILFLSDGNKLLLHDNNRYINLLDINSKSIVTSNFIPIISKNISPLIRKDGFILFEGKGFQRSYLAIKNIPSLKIQDVFFKLPRSKKHDPVIHEIIKESVPIIPQDLRNMIIEYLPNTTFFRNKPRISHFSEKNQKTSSTKTLRK
jgi:hypothetical protein